MTILAAILAGLLPSFALVVLGGLVRGRLTVAAWTGLDRLNFEVLFPALLFSAAAARPMDVARVITIGPAVWAIMALGLLAAWTARRFGPEQFLDFAGAWQCSWRFNTALGFVAVGTLTHADASLMAVAAGMAVPIANVFAVTALSRGGQLGLWATVRRVALNPFLLASTAGVIVGLSGVTLPHLIMAPLSLMAQAAIPTALLSIGATMSWTALARLDAFSGIITATKLILLPGATFAACQLMSADPPMTAILTMFAALPTASGAHVLAAGFGADRQIVATLVAQSTLISAVTLPAWIWLIEATAGG